MSALSVIIATTQPWPEVRGALESLYGQAKAIPAEIIVADGDGRARPETELFPGVIWIHSPGDSVYELRALAMRRATGAIVAITEDHCVLHPDWCQRTLAAHRDFPDAAVIGGAVENGATGSLMDWASFFYVNGEAMLPLKPGPCLRITQSNLSYKRRALDTVLASGASQMEWMANEQLRRQGQTLALDGRIVASHVQSLGFRGTCLLHFHGSRSIAGFRCARIGWPERLVRLGACAVMPPLLFVRALATVLAKRRMTGLILASTPSLALLVCIRAAGAFAGFIAGPGASPRHIR